MKRVKIKSGKLVIVASGNMTQKGIVKGYTNKEKSLVSVRTLGRIKTVPIGQIQAL